jgi:predicted metal-dependent enzyme (double-stranded beta helix superfamily)
VLAGSGPPGLARREDISMSATDEFVSRSITAAAEETPMLAVKEIVEQTLRDKRVEAELSTDVGLRVLHLSDDLTVLNVVAPRRRDYALPRRPHDHRMWAVIGIMEGQEDNEFFRRADDTIVPSGGRRVDTGEVLLLGSDVIHSFGNPLSDHVTCALHVYGGDLVNARRSMWNEPDWREEPYDVKKATGTTFA